MQGRRPGILPYPFVCVHMCVHLYLVHVAKVRPLAVKPKILRGFTGYFHIRFTVESCIKPHKITSSSAHVLENKVGVEGHALGGTYITNICQSDYI